MLRKRQTMNRPGTLTIRVGLLVEGRKMKANRWSADCWDVKARHANGPDYHVGTIAYFAAGESAWNAEGFYFWSDLGLGAATRANTLNGALRGAYALSKGRIDNWFGL